MSTNDSNVTKPTISTVLERLVSLEERLNGRIDGLEERMNARFDGVDKRLDHMDGRLHHNDVRLDHVDDRFDNLEIRFDRLESVAHTTRGDVLGLRADFNGLQKRLREHFQALP